MIVRARAPLRLGLAGGGTDVSPYPELYGGSVLNATIDKYIYASISKRDVPEIVIASHDQGLRCVYPLSDSLPIDGTLDLLKAVYNRVCRDFCQSEPLALSISTYSEAPAGSGLGSSSTLVVALLQAFVEFLNLPLGEYDIAHLAYEIERIDLGLAGGRQDQYAAAFGGINFIEFQANDRVIVNPLRVRTRITTEFESSLLLCFTGASRQSADIIRDQVRNVSAGNRSLEAMHELKASAHAMKEALLRGQLDRVAEMLQQGWLSKRNLADSISNSHIERIMDAAYRAGAQAGKVSGAGGGGFMMFMVPLEQRQQVIRALTAEGGQVETCRLTSHGAKAWRAQ